MSVSVFIEWCNYQHGQNAEYFVTSKGNPAPFLLPYPLVLPEEIINLLSVSMNFLNLNVSSNWNPILYGALCLVSFF